MPNHFSILSLLNQQSFRTDSLHEIAHIIVRGIKGEAVNIYSLYFHLNTCTQGGMVVVMMVVVVMDVRGWRMASDSENSPLTPDIISTFTETKSGKCL